jgi:hypothetical protein
MRYREEQLWDPWESVPLSRVKALVDRLCFFRNLFELRLCGSSTSDDALSLLSAFAGFKVVCGTEVLRVICDCRARLDLAAMVQEINAMPRLTPVDINVSNRFL